MLLPELGVSQRVLASHIVWNCKRQFRFSSHNAAKVTPIAIAQLLLARPWRALGGDPLRRRGGDRDL